MVASLSHREQEVGRCTRFDAYVCRNSTGTPSISYEEELFMVKLSDAGGVVDIDLLDFMVIGACNYASGRVETIL